MKNVNTVKSIVTGLFAVTVTSAAWAGLDRTLTVSDPDAEGNVTIALGDGGDANGQALIAAWAPADRGDDVNAWDEFRYVGKVKVLPTDTARTFALPENWRTRSGCVRFFLMEKNLPFPTYIAYATRPDVPNGGLYFNTQIKPNKTLDIAVKFSSPNTSGMSPFGISSLVYVMQKSNACYYFDFFGAKASAKTSGELDASYVNVFNEAPPNAASKFVEARLNRNGIFLNGHLHLAFDPTKITESTSTSAISLFGRNGGWKQNGTTCSISAAKIWMNGELVRDMIPCQITSGEVRMYDRKNANYYSKVNGSGCTASLEAGPEIDPVPSDAGAPVSRSRTFVFAPTLAIAAIDRKTCSATLTIGAGHDAGQIFAVGGAADAGTSYSAWDKALFVADVAAGVNTVTVTLPEAWWKAHDQVRFVWVAKACAAYDRQLTYLHSDATACDSARLSTGWVPNRRTSIAVNARTAKDVCAFGVTTHFYLFHNGDNKVYGGFAHAAGNYALTDPTGFASAFHNWELSADGASVDGEQKLTFDPSVINDSDCIASVSVPFRVNYQSGSLSGKEGNVEVASAKMWDGDFLGLDLVPCVKDGVVGFYDRVRKTFNAGKKGGDFVAGDWIVANGDALAWTEAKQLTSGLVLVVR